jgi:kindlin 2
MGDSLANNTLTMPTLFSSTTPNLRSTIAINKITDSSFHNQHSISNLSKSLTSLTINDGNLARTPLTPKKNLLLQLIQPINLIEKCKLNNLWFDSSKSLMEQNIRENDLILLRFKYYSFYDLNPKVNQII